MKKDKILAILGLVFTVIVWGLSFLSIKVAVKVVPPMTLGFLRFLISSIFLSIIYFSKEKNNKIEKKDLHLLIIAGFIGVTVYFFFENYGIKLLSASTASLIIATIPIFTLLFESFIYKIKLTGIKIISVIISFFGVCLLFSESLGGSFKQNTKLGYFFMFGAVLAWVLYSLVTKPLFGKYSQLTITYYQIIFGTILFIPFTIFERFNISEINWIIILNILFLGIFCSAIGYLLYIISMDKLGVSTSSLYLNILPIVTIIASYFILNEKIDVYKILGGILIILSVYLSNIEFKLNKVKVDKFDSC